MTQLEMAREGRIAEGVTPAFIRQGIEKGTIVICSNINHLSIEPLAIGEVLRTKVNANIGTSKDHVDLNVELEKLQIATDAGGRCRYGSFHRRRSEKPLWKRQK